MYQVWLTVFGYLFNSQSFPEASITVWWFFSVCHEAWKARCSLFVMYFTDKDKDNDCTISHFLVDPPLFSWPRPGKCWRFERVMSVALSWLFCYLRPENCCFTSVWYVCSCWGPNAEMLLLFFFPIVSVTVLWCWLFRIISFGHIKSDRRDACGDARGLELQAIINLVVLLLRLCYHNVFLLTQRWLCCQSVSFIDAVAWKTQHNMYNREQKNIYYLKQGLFLSNTPRVGSNFIIGELR